MKINILPITNISFAASKKIKQTESSCAKNTFMKKNDDEFTCDRFERNSKTASFSQATFEKAKEIVMKSILCERPRESLVCIMDDKIIYSQTGQLSSIDATDEMNELLKNPENSIAIVHSHPQNIIGKLTMPVSLDDFIALNSREAARSMYAINTKGEYSCLEKIGNKRPSFVELLYFNMKHDEIVNNNAEYISAPPELAVKVESLLSAKLGKQEDGVYPDDVTEEDVLMAHLSAAQQYPEYAFVFAYNQAKCALLQHIFWCKYAKRLHVKYDTNFSF